MTVSRRRFLATAAVGLSLPAFTSLAPRASAGPSSPTPRFVAFYVPNGMHMPAWTPASEGNDYELPPILAPLAAVRQHVDVISGMRNDPADIETAGHHAAGTAGFLTGRRARRSESNLEIGASLDQLFAQRSAGATILDALVLGTDGGDAFGDCDNGFSCAYSRNVSWIDASTPRPKVVDPRLAFDLLFRGYDPAATATDQQRRQAHRTSVLDAVREQTVVLEGALGQDDRNKLERYRHDVRALEQRIQKPVLQCDPAAAPDEPADFSEHVELMMDVIALAFRCDATRTATFMLGNSASDRSYEFLGIEGTHHGLSHTAELSDRTDDLVAIGAWEVDCFAGLLGRLAEQDEAGASLLDETVLYFSSEISSGPRHTHDDLPILYAGGSALGRTTGRHIRLPGEPLANLHLTTAGTLGLGLDEFGEDGVRRLPV